MKRPSLLAPPTAAPDATEAPDAPVGWAVVRADRARLRRATRARRRAEAAEVRRFTRSARRRRVVAAVAGGILVVSVATPVLLAVSPAFAVRTVAVTGADTALAGQVRRALAPELGVPIALVDGGAVTARIARVAGVQSFSVARLPPGTLAVRVVPRVAVAQLRVAGAYHLVDPAGVTLRVAPTRIPGVPVVTAAPGSAAFTAAAAVLRSLPAPLARRVTAVRATTADDVRLALSGGRLVIWGSADDSAAKVAALSAALVRVARGAHRIDVSVPGSVAVG